MALRAFHSECDALLGVLDTLEAEDFERATNCPPWNLHELVVHIAFSLSMPKQLKSGAGEPASAADYYRRPERSTGAYRSSNVDRTRSVAATVAREDVVPKLRDSARAAQEMFARHAPDELIEAGGLTISVSDYLLTRLMSVAAHGVDVAITLDRPAWTTPWALSALRPVLVDLLGAEPPEEWSDQDLLEFGTGRLSFSDPRFPLLS